MITTFEHWTKGRSPHLLSTNWKAESLPFQRWRHFKEAFAPELVARAVRESPGPVHHCLDPFGGSGTTALACQFLGVRPSTIEVNPFLADLIAAKLTEYDTTALLRDLRSVIIASHNIHGRREAWASLPPTFVEPGINDRWIFDRGVANRLFALRTAISDLRDRKSRRLFKVLLGGILIEVSNVITSGKGRRYRKNWAQRRYDPTQVTELFIENAESAIAEVHQFSNRPCLEHEVYCGDARERLDALPSADLAVFSPPYPNSFDYTDVYNVELWALGYLTKKENRRLREATLTSHVQIARDFAEAPSCSPKLRRTMRRLNLRRDELWNKSIPEMVGGYFYDMDSVLSKLQRIVARRGTVWMVVGDSQYADVPIRVSAILCEIAEAQGWAIHLVEPFRSMRSSAQQGGEYKLGEDLVVLSKV